MDNNSVTHANDQETTTSLHDRENVPAPYGLPWGWHNMGKAVLFITVGSLLLMGIVMAGMVVTGTIPDEAAGLAAGPIFGLGIGMYLIVMLAVYRFAVQAAAESGKSNWRALGWRGFDGKWIWALPPLLFLQFAGMAVANILFVVPFVGNDFENPQIEAITGGGTLSTNDLWLLMLLIAVVAPIAEELFFRGMLYPLLRLRLSMWPAIVVNGLLFSVIHLLPPLLPGLFIVGMVLAWVRERSGSLIPCILLHALQNGIVLLGIYNLVRV